MTATLHEDQYKPLSYLAHFFLAWEMFHTEVVEKIENNSLYKKNFCSKIVSFMR